MLDILEWILDIAALDVRRMSPVALFFCVLVFGGLSLLLIIVPIAKFVEGPSSAEAPAMLLALILGGGMLARLVYGLFCRWRGRTYESSNEVEH